MALGASDSRYEFVLAAQDAFSKEIAKLKSELKKLSGDFQKYGREADKASQQAGRGFQSMSGEMIKAGAVIGLLYQGWDKLKTSLSYPLNFEQTRVSFEVLFGSVEKGRQMLEELSEFGKATPFTLPQVRDAAVQMKAYGIEAENIIPTMRMMGDLSLGNSEKFGRLTYAYGQVQAAGQLFGSELRQFTETGIPLISALADHFGVAESAIKKMTEEGRISATDVTAALQKLSGEGGQFFGLMDKGAKTLSGVWSNIIDTYIQWTERLVDTSAYQTLLEYANRIQKALPGMLDRAAEAAAKLAKAFAGILPVLGPLLAGALKLAIAGLGKLGEYVQSAREMWSRLPGPLRAAVIGLTGVTVAVGLLTKVMMANPIGLAIMGIVTASIFLYRNWDWIWNGIKELPAKAWNFIKKGINLIIDGLNKLGSAIEQVHAGWGWHLDSMSVEIENAGNRMTSASFIAGRAVVQNFAAIKKAAFDPIGAFGMLKEKVVTTGKSVIEGLKRMNAESKPPVDALAGSLGGGGGGGGLGGAAKQAAEEVTEAAASVSKDFIKLKADIGAANREYRDLALEAGKALQQMTKEHNDKIAEMDASIAKLKKSLADIRADLKKGLGDLEEDYENNKGGLNMSKAEAAVEQEKKIAEMQAEHDQKRKDGLKEIARLTKEQKTQEAEDARKALGKELDDLQAKLDKEQAALDAFNRNQVFNNGELEAARQNASLTDFERTIQGINKQLHEVASNYETRRQELKTDADERTQQAELELQELETKKNKEIEVFTAARAEYEKTESVFVKFEKRFLAGLTAMSTGAEAKLIVISNRFRALKELIDQVGQFNPDDQGYSFAGVQSAAAARSSTTNNSTSNNAVININVSGNPTGASAQDIKDAVIRALQQARFGSS